MTLESFDTLIQFTIHVTKSDVDDIIDAALNSHIVCKILHVWKVSGGRSMLKLYWFRDLTNKENHRKIKGLNILYGCSCRSAYVCKNANQCKYAKLGRREIHRHNRTVSIRRWFYYRFHFNLPWLVYFSTHSADLSGTTKCPFHMCRRFTCNACKHSYYDEHMNGCCFIPYSERDEVSEDSEYFRDWGKHYRCGSIEIDKFYMNYNKYTGELS